MVGYGLTNLRMTVAESEHIVSEARRRFHRHNAGRRFVEAELFGALARSAREDLSTTTVRDRLRGTPDVREALEWMWPVLTPAQLLHDLYGSRALLRNAGRRLLSDEEWAALVRPRSETVEQVPWTNDDAPLLDEARSLLGPKPRTRRPGTDPTDEEVRTYGHIVVDEAQDLSPMQLLMLERRSLNGSMTVVGDIAQSTGEWAHANWQEILDHLPDRRPARRAELTVGYRLPAPNMALASRVLAVADPDLKPPRSIREDGESPRIVRSGEDELAERVVTVAIEELEAVGTGNVAVIVPASMVDPVSRRLHAGRSASSAGPPATGSTPRSRWYRWAWSRASSSTPRWWSSRQPSSTEEAQGLRALYVALTRATKRLAIVHAADLPEALQDRLASLPTRGPSES